MESKRDISECIRKYQGCLSHLAFSPQQTLGRERSFDEDEIIEEYFDPYERDRKAILAGKSLRRLGNKTQVFIHPENPHVRQRSHHTYEVAETALGIASLLGFNQQLCEAIAWGHDLGHAPYGHLGEKAISRMILGTTKKNGDIINKSPKEEFKHERFSVVVARNIERQGRGLNLSYETLLGILYHSGSTQPPKELDLPLECHAAAFADKIAYVFADVNDAEREGLPNYSEAQKKATFFGENQRKRVQTCLIAMLEESAEAGVISFSKSEVAQAFRKFKTWMQEEVYNPFDRSREYLPPALHEIHDKFLASHEFFQGCNPIILLALLTDEEVDWLPNRLRNRHPITLAEITRLGIAEIVPYIRGKTIDFTAATLDVQGFRKDF